MSIPVDAKDLIRTIEEFGSAAYLITSNADSHPHVTHLGFQILEDALFFELGKRSTKNVEMSPLISILWPPVESGGYNLTIDGTITQSQNKAEPGDWKVHISSAILHRPAQLPFVASNDDCTSDCKTI